MRRIRREEILDWSTYGDERPKMRDRALAEKALRRVHVGEHLTFLFENPFTIRYQIQEMIWAERIVREADILHEIETYNEILGGDGELGCTLLVEIEEPAERDIKLREWWGLPEHIYVRLENGERIAARFDPRQRGDGRLSSVQYLQFAVGESTPVAIGVDLPQLTIEAPLESATRVALAADLAGLESETIRRA
jgi:hypothetical protein